MPTLAVVNMKGEKTGEIELSDQIFGIAPHVFAMHTAVVNYLANQRQGTKSALTRAEVSGGGKKPWKQKGTGRARQGSIRSPQWRHGGVVFAPKPRDYRYSVNKKIKRLSLKSALSSKILEEKVIILDEIALNEFKTKIMAKILENLGVKSKTLIILPNSDKKIVKSVSNLPSVSTIQANLLNTYSILNAVNLIILKEAVKRIEEVYP